mmetsp:Transcript_20980/g.64996  ORF Transcript_20980/g.64996 Transcript_20980/m.64996 type:complete len:215 (-) Transcript_20980:113-757(-)
MTGTTYLKTGHRKAGPSRSSMPPAAKSCIIARGSGLPPASRSMPERFSKKASAYAQPGRPLLSSALGGSRRMRMRSVLSAWPFQNWCVAPFGMERLSPSCTVSTSPSTSARISPSRTVNVSSSRGCACIGGLPARPSEKPGEPAGTVSSNSKNLSPVAAAGLVTTKRGCSSASGAFVSARLRQSNAPSAASRLAFLASAARTASEVSGVRRRAA